MSKSISGMMYLERRNKKFFPYLEAILSVLPICDEFVVLVVNSENVFEEVKDLSNKLSKIKPYFYECNKEFKPEGTTRARGVRIREMQNIAIEKTKGDYIFLVQADEAFKWKDLPKIKNLVGVYDSIYFRRRPVANWLMGEKWRFYHNRLAKKTNNLKTVIDGAEFCQQAKIIKTDIDYFHVKIEPNFSDKFLLSKNKKRRRNPNKTMAFFYQPTYVRLNDIDIDIPEVWKGLTHIKKSQQYKIRDSLIKKYKERYGD